MPASEDDDDYEGYVFDTRDERPRDSSPPAARGALWSFNTSNVPSFKDIEQFHMKQREDWPGLHRKFIATLGLTYSFVVVNASDVSRQPHSEIDIAKAREQERVWMSAYGPHRQLLEATIYSAIKKCWSGFTDALKLFGPINANSENCAGAIWTKLLETYPLDDRGTLAILMARELSLVVHPDVRSVDDYNVFCAEVADRRLSLADHKFTIDEMFTCVELAYYYKHSKPHLANVHNSVKDKIEKGEALTPALLQKYVQRHLQRAGATTREHRTERQAFSVVTDGRCKGCQGCSLHCKDHSGQWRDTPTNYDSDGDRDRRHVRRSERPASPPTIVSKNGTRRKYHTKADRDMAYLAAKCHPDPDNDGNEPVSVQQRARDVGKTVMLMYLAQHLSDNEDQVPIDDLEEQSASHSDSD